ncbi:hypothetical protein GZ78_00965 [Endozoicomonas numazuensis]|uniref:Uncharacterized protein n=2 Tax=Endozoicomonas numazuensis TaxID=1137799 RepID=A0A081NJU3_9GAMM|nr:hypothetical protein GZ78_00965 [Endozoicomonas numazuensis]
MRFIFSLLLVTAPLKSQSVEIDRAVLVRSMHNVLFLIIRVIENQVSTFYHIYQLQESLGQYWGSHLEQLDSVKVNEQYLTVKIASFEEVSYIPTEFTFIRWVAPNECNFR